MKGWKTWVGALMLGLSAIPPLAPIAPVLTKVGSAFIAVGLGHKVEKAVNGKGGKS